MFAPILALAVLSTPSPRPHPRQLAWQAMEANAFVHFGPNTFTDVEWGGGKEDPNLFQPTSLDCDQWVRAFKSAGFKGVILTAKHHDGFCLWPSKLSTHTVAQSTWRNGRGDVVKELSDACRRGGLKFGIYLSPWDRNHPTYGTPEYNKVFAGMLKEVLTHYGPIFEVWFDGANGEGPNGKKQVYDWDLFVGTVRKYQPQAVIFSDAGPDVRWVGNEEGFAGETCWATVPSGRYVPGTPYYTELTEGKRGTDLWVPAECDVSIRPGWFYHADQNMRVKSPEALLDLYEKSVGRNSLFLLNVPPDRTGKIAPPDIAALKGFGALRERIYGRNLAVGGRQWVERGAKGSVEGTFTLALKKPVTFDRIDLREPIQKGQKIAAFTVESKQGEAWAPVVSGTTVGHRRILIVPTTTSTALRVRVTDGEGRPDLLPIRLFMAGTTASAAERGPFAGKQDLDGNLTLRAISPATELQWSFEGVRGEVNVEVAGTGEGEVELEIGGQTLRGTVSGTQVKLGKAAIVVGGSTSMRVRVVGGSFRIQEVRLRPLS